MRGLDALSDFAGGISLETSEIDRERGVVIEEWRGRQGPGRAWRPPRCARCSVTRSIPTGYPIGLPDVLKTFPAQRLRDFYRDFYRPDRMAVVAVGDFDTERIEALIREHFGTLSAAASGGTLYPVQLNPGTR